MARQISLHEVIDALDKVLAQLDDLTEKGKANQAELARAESTLNQVKATLLGLCESDDKGYVYYMVNN